METRSLLDGNMTVLFGDESAEFRQHLTNWLDAAREQVRRALAEEHDVDTIRQRLTMAVALTDMVVQRMREKMELLRSRNLL
jgi:glucose-6-phosphate-specific signal transduction histidine kinase